MLIAAAFFVAVVAIFVGLYWAVVLRPEEAQDRALKKRLNPTRTQIAVETISLLNRVAPLSTLPVLEKLLKGSARIVQPLERLIERSGLRVTVGHLVLGTLFFGMLGFYVGFRFGNVWIGLAAGLIVALIPYAVVRQAASRRIKKFEEQFPEAIDLMARALRAGHALTTGLGMVAEEAPEPVRSEFKLLYDRQNYGMAFPDALRSFGERVPLLDAQFFVTAVLTQREAGGNLAEVLDGLSALIRQRFQLKRQVRVVSAHGRITASVLTFLPVVLTGVLYVIAPNHISILFTDPLGLRMVGGALIMQVIGFLVMRRIVDIEV